MPPRFLQGQLEYYLVPLDEEIFGDVKVTLIVVPPTPEHPERRFFWPINAICMDVLHVQAQRQLQRLRANSKTAPLIEKLFVKTPTGMHEGACLEYQGLGEWFYMIHTSRMADRDIARKLDAFQARAVKIVNAVLFGLVKPIAPELAGPATTPRITAADALETAQSALNLSLLTEQRQERVEQMIFGRQPYVNETDDEGIINLPFEVQRPGRYIIRLRHLPWQAPEIVEIVPDDE